MVNISHYCCLPFCGLKYTAVKAAIKQILQAVNEMKENFSRYFHTRYQSIEKFCNILQVSVHSMFLFCNYILPDPEFCPPSLFFAICLSIANTSGVVKVASNSKKASFSACA